jgi:glycerol-3-phosphate O-acyltransferase/dihydroxyacetone phosphate acyltransferase
MNRKLITGYTHYKDHPRIIQLKKNVIQYNKKLKQLGLRDHQVEVAARNSLENSGILLFRVLKLLFLFSLSLPGTILFGPIFIVTDHIARKKQKLALAKSVVKVKAVDVIATWKIIVATIFAPTLYITYSIIGTYLIKNYNILGLENLGTFQLLVLSYLVLVLTTYAAFRIGEIGVDILKSLPPLMHAVFGSNKELSRLKKTKENLQMEITEIVNDLGPKLFPEFDKFTRAKDQDDHGEELETRGRSSKPSEVERGDDHMRSISTSSATSVSSIGLSRVTSEGYLSDIPILGDGWRNNDYYRSSSSSSSDLDDIYKKSGGTGTEKESKTSTKLRKLMRERIQAEDNDE